MYDRSDPLAWGRACSPVPAERSSAAAGGRGSTLAIAAITVFVLCLSLTVQAQSKTAPVPKSRPTHNDDAQLYRNAAFGFHFQVPYGWVDRTQEMQEGDEAGKSALLLAVFERPPDATGDTVNSAVVIASESAASYKGLKKAEDYLGPLTELATAKGFKPDGDPYPLEIESRQLVRADFVKTISEKLTMRQCTLVLLAKGQIVSFTFIAGSEDELDDLMDGLHFTVAKSPSH
jgi:hypothetical protein